MTFFLPVMNEATFSAFSFASAPEQLKKVPHVAGLRGRGLMIGIDLPEEFGGVRRNLLMKHHIFTGEAKPNTIRLLPSLAVSREEADIFLEALKTELA